MTGLSFRSCSYLRRSAARYCRHRGLKGVIVAVQGNAGSLDSRAWATATWSAPLVAQLILALLIASAWLLGKWFPGPALPLFAASAAGVFVLCAVATFVLIRSTSSRARGMALSVAGSYVVVLVGATLYGIWMLPW